MLTKPGHGILMCAIILACTVHWKTKQVLTTLYTQNGAGDLKNILQPVLTGT